MAVERINPGDVYPPYDNNYSQVTRARGGVMVEVAGTIAFDEGGNMVGEGDMRAQVRQILTNIDRMLAAGGATRADVTRMMIHTLDTATYLREGHPEVKAFFGDHLPVSTLVGCSQLADPRFIVEIHVTAVVD